MPPCEFVPVGDARRLSAGIDIESEGRFARLLLDDEEPAWVSVRPAVAPDLLFAQVKSEEGDIRRRRATEERIARSLTRCQTPGLVPLGLGGKDDGGRIPAQQFAANQQDQRRRSGSRPVLPQRSGPFVNRRQGEGLAVGLRAALVPEGTEVGPAPIGRVFAPE